MKRVPGCPAGSLLFLVLLLISATVLVKNATAQSEASEIIADIPEEEVGEKAAKLLGQIRGVSDDIARYREKLATATREDSLVLRLQIFNRQVAGLGDLDELADLLVELEQSGAQDELRSEVEAAYELITPRLWPGIDDVRGEIDSFRAMRIDTAADARLQLEQRIATLTGRLDAFYDIAREHIATREQLGIDVIAAYAAFDAELSSRADELAGRIDLALARIDEVSARIPENPNDSNAPVLLAAASKSLDTNTGSMTALLDLMDGRELPTEVYRAQLVTATRDITTGILDSDVAVSLVSRAWDNSKDWVAKNGPRLSIKLLLFLAVLLAFRVLARLARAGVAKALDTSKLNVSTLLRRMIITGVSNLVMLFGLLVALSQLGISLGPLLAGFGVVGFILGFALQDSLANFAAGLMILIYRPYDVGDSVDVGGVFGKVNKMSLVSTTILTFDNQTLVVPNNKIWGDVIKNVTAQDTRRVDMVFGISYTDDIPQAERILRDILDKHDKVLDDPESNVRLHTLGESSVDFIVRPWVAASDYWDVYWDVTRAVKMRFDEEGVSIPFPQRDVHLFQEQTNDTQEGSDR